MTTITTCFECEIGSLEMSIGATNGESEFIQITIDGRSVSMDFDEFVKAVEYMGRASSAINSL